jgi:two-component system sensor histidine kinase AlgZ
VKDSQILSAFHELPGSGAGSAVSVRAAPHPLLFDACQVGVVLRAVALVQVVVAVAALYQAHSPSAWVLDVALLTVGALPGCLLWLVVACGLKRWLAHAHEALQWTVGVALGAVAGVLAGEVLAFLGVFDQPARVAAGCTGALLGGAQVMMLVMRARGQLPADTAARLAELQARIRPHFLFNTLNSAIALVRREPARAEALLEDLSDLFRQALADQTHSVSVADEVALAQRYLAIEQVRFGDRLQLQWQLDPRADDARLPPLLLQPLVENAVQHGVEPSPQGAQVRISTERRGEVVVIKVTNTVPAGQGQAGHGLALDNVRRRLQLLHDVRMQFRAALVDGVYQVRIEVPA